MLKLLNIGGDTFTLNAPLRRAKISLPLQGLETIHVSEFLRGLLTCLFVVKLPRGLSIGIHIAFTCNLRCLVEIRTVKFRLHNSLTTTTISTRTGQTPRLLNTRKISLTTKLIQLGLKSLLDVRIHVALGYTLSSKRLRRKRAHLFGRNSQPCKTLKRPLL